MKVPNFYIEDMIEAIELVQKYLTGISELNFSRDTELQDAVIRRLMIIGEAATKLTEDIKSHAPNVRWKTIIGFRNVAIHDYANISMGKVWEIYQSDLPTLHAQLTELLAKLPAPPNPGES